MKLQPNEMTFARVEHANFEELADLRVAAMRESLERVGRFDETRARERLRKTFSPEHTHGILVAGAMVGFYALRPADGAFALDHLYVLPEFQGRGIGAIAMERILSEADQVGLAVQVGALKGSKSNLFYQRHGFQKTGEGDWDIYYSRRPLGRGSEWQGPVADGLT